MRPNLEKRSKLIAIVAFLQRTVGISFRSFQKSRFGVGIEKRARRCLSLLNTNEKGLTFKIALENLRFEFDLLMEEAALVPDGLELHRKVVELAERHEIADVIVREMFNRPPVVRLFFAILAEARNADASLVQFDLINKLDTFPVFYEVQGNRIEAMRIPSTLEVALRGMFARAEVIGFKVIAAHFEQNLSLPKDIGIKWINPQRLEITIDHPTIMPSEDTKSS